MTKTTSIRLAVALLVALIFSNLAFARSSTAYKKGSKSQVTESTRVQKKITRMRSSRTLVRHSKLRKSRRHRYYEHFSGKSFVETDQTQGDLVGGEDPIVRAAAVEALGNMNGTVVAIDPDTGRVLTMVNQKLALSEGAQPCSTIKVAVALAALSEGVITHDDTLLKMGRAHMDLTYALAHSNNGYFEELGRRLGFEKVSYYAHQFGLGELAGYNIDGEHLGAFPTEPLASKLGGVGKMCSFGESISLTPLQLGALMSAMANGGNLYYLQHPTNQDELANFQPKLKRTLPITPYVADLMPGMGGAVEYGTARSLRTSFSEEQIIGKTGTCSKDGTRFGWFASYANTQHGRIVTVVFLQGGRPTYGPKAAEITGKLYRGLYDRSFFAVKTTSRDQTTVGTGISQ
jgi:penicillin-binding protein 2